MAVGLPLKTTYANGDVYSASDVNDTNGTINAYLAPSLGFAAGKNKIINGDFGVWQRGTSLTTNGFLADRWTLNHDSNPTSFTQSQQTFTPGTAPVTGYEGQYFWRYAITTLGSGSGVYLVNRMEDVRTFAGQTVTLSFWAKANANVTINAQFDQRFGTGGSATVNTMISSSIAVTTSWTRFTRTVAVPSVSGKTIGASSMLQFFFNWTPTASQTVDIWGVQIEAGSTATAFQTATGTIQGELAACQRYYYRQTVSTNYGYLAFGMCNNSTSAKIQIPLPVPLRVVPTSLDSPTASTLRVTDGTTGTTLNGTPTLDSDTSNSSVTFNVGVASGLTQYRAIWFGANNSSSAYIGFSAEL
jgi:hypothetical protein